MTAIIKEADFLEGFIKSSLGSLSPTKWVHKPFEMAFSVLGPMVLWRINWMLGALAFVGDQFGYGPSYIGKLIDQHLGLGDGKLDITDDKLKEASESATEDFLKKIQGFQSTSADETLKSLIQVRGHFKKEDIITACYVAKYDLKKEAKGIIPSNRGDGLTSRILRLFSGPKYTSTISGLIYGLIKTLGKGILGAAVAAGVLSQLGVGKKEEKQQQAPQIEQAIPGVKQQYYSNVAKNVEDTLIKFLDATIENFSNTYQKLYKHQLKNSPEMKEILEMVERMNRTAISTINDWDAFMAPTVLDIAYKLMPKAKYEKIDSTQNDELKTLLK